MGGVSSFFERPAKKHISIPMSTPSLKRFIANVPTCTQKMNIATVLAIFSSVKREAGKNQSGYTDRLVVVNEQQRPLGILYLSSLLPYLGVGIRPPLKEPEKNPEISPHTQAPSAIEETSHQEINLRQSLSELGLSIIEPLAIVPADFTLKQFWPYLQEPTHQTNSFSHWALVDKAGKFLGLLDSEHLLQFVVKGLLPENLSDIPTIEPSAATFPGVSHNTHNSQGSLSPLVELLERLPLPIMLQTSSGRSVSQNFAWRQHFGALEDPELIRREAAALLEKVPNPAETSKVGDWGERVSNFTNFDFSPLSASLPGCSMPNLINPSLDGSLPQVCHLGNNPNTCFCVCTMQNGSERVWQFVKIPLDNFLANPDLLWAEKVNSKDVLEELLSAGNFYLATIGANNDDPAGIPPTPILRTNHQPGYSSYRSQYEALKLKLAQQKSQQQTPNTSLWLMLATDVTEQQQVAKELAAKNADLIQLNRLKDEFLACISHELKTPLTAVLGLSSLLKDQLLGELNDRQIRYTKLIHQSARHLMTVVNDILDLTRMETGQLELTLAPVDVLTVCDRAYQQARQLYLGKNKTDEEDLNNSAREPNYTLVIEPGLDTLIADELRLRQMLVNLISNGIKFTEENGAIGLHVSRWEGWIAFKVWDTGIGIPDRKQHLIFQKFQQLENPLTRQFDGTGLGLVLTQRLARLHGGDVTFISKVGTGSEFTLLLPPSPPKKAWKLGEQKNIINDDEDHYSSSVNHHLSSPVYGEIEVTVPHPTVPSRIVLLVEATPKLIEDLSQQLLGLGYRIVIARSGTEALEKARRLQPCTIFLNPLLPLLSGWDVLTLLKASPQTQHIPVIVTATVAEKEYAYSKRADSFLSLPVQLDALQNALESIAIPTKLSEKEQSTGAGLTILRLSIGSVNQEEVSRLHHNQLGLETSDLETSTKEQEHPQREKTDSTFSHFHPDLSRLLHQYNYRVLEADDLEQGELLARIWQPDVVLLDGKVANSFIYMEQLSQRDALISLPLVILDEQMAQAAMHVSSQKAHLPLQVFPCLPTTESLSETTTLLQVIQVAAGMTYKPTILVVDISHLPDLRNNVNQIEKLSSDHPSNQSQNLSAIASTNKKRSEWLQALIQYLQTAEFKAVVGHSWEEVLRQVQHHSVDLLLIDLADSLPNSLLIQAFDTLRCIGQRPPTLVLTKQFNTDTNADNFASSVNSSINFLEPIVREVAAKFLPTSLSMEELLEEIRRTLS